MRIIFLNNRLGQSLVEVIIAVAVAAIVIVAAVGLFTLSLRVGVQDKSLQTAGFLVQELLDNVTVMAESDWQQMGVAGGPYYIDKDLTDGDGFLSVDNSGCTAASPYCSQTVALEGVVYAASFQIEDVQRGGGAIVPSGGTGDPSTKKITVTVSWQGTGGPQEVKADKYITRSRNAVINQTNWQGGAGAEGPYTKPVTTFDGANTTNVDTVTTPGSIRIQGL